MRFLGPVLMPQLFMADFFKKWDEGTLYEFNWYDFLSAFAGVNFRSGMGIYLIDNFMQSFKSVGEERMEQVTKQMAQEYVGELGATFVHPIQIVKDFHDQIKYGVTTQRETRAFDPL